MMDDFSIGMIVVGAIVLGPIVALIVGSQTESDAKFIADCTFVCFFGMLVLTALRFMIGSAQVSSTGLGLVVLFLALIIGAGLGSRVARSRAAASKSGGPEDGGKPAPWDDELA